MPWIRRIRCGIFVIDSPIRPASFSAAAPPFCELGNSNPILPFNFQAGLTPLQARTKPDTSPFDLSTAYGVLAAWADPNASVDVEGNTAVHLCELPQIIEALAGHPLVDVNAVNTVRKLLD